MKPIAVACATSLLVLSACSAWRPGLEANMPKSAASPTPDTAPADGIPGRVPDSTPPKPSPPAANAADGPAAAAPKSVTPADAPGNSAVVETPAKSKQPTSHPAPHAAPVEQASPVAAKQPVANPPAQRPAATPPLDVAALEQRLKDTHAIGLFTKLSLKNQVDDLLAQFRTHFRGNGSPPLSDLRQRYDLLMLKVLSLLQDGDPPLAQTIGSSREAIWNILSDPNKLATISS